jgi:hypothetical protein
MGTFRNRETRDGNQQPRGRNREPVDRLAVALALCLVSLLPIAGLARQGTDLAVTVTYTGKGPVDASNDILVFLFDHPNVGADSRPLRVQSVTKNGGVATFKGVTAPTVYILTAYDEKANYDGRSGPPPAGTPIGSYSNAGKPTPVEPAKTPKVSMKFGDTTRWK